MVRYLIAEIELGAQLTDAGDMRLLRTLCEAWFSDELFTAESFALTPFITSPPRGLTSLQQHLDYFNSLPDCDSPETFGLTPSADST